MPFNGRTAFSYSADDERSGASATKWRLMGESAREKKDLVGKKSTPSRGYYPSRPMFSSRGGSLALCLFLMAGCDEPPKRQSVSGPPKESSPTPVRDPVLASETRAMELAKKAGTLVRGQV